MKKNIETCRKPTKNWIDRICQICNLSFKVKPYRVRNGHGLYCSQKCLSVANGRKVAATIDMKGENNPHWKGGLTQNHYAYKLRDKERHPEHHRARELVAKAKKNGKLIVEPCHKCGAIKKVHAHHEDYSKPLDVKWICPPCHRAEHY
jgi:hypothetical protein